MLRGARTCVRTSWDWWKVWDGHRKWGHHKAALIPGGKLEHFLRLSLETGEPEGCTRFGDALFLVWGEE